MKLLTAAPLVFQVNIKSLEDVVRAYLKLAEEKTETAKGESQQMVLDIEDLDNIQTPERYRKLKAHAVPSYWCLDSFFLFVVVVGLIHFSHFRILLHFVSCRQDMFSFGCFYYSLGTCKHPASK